MTPRDTGTGAVLEAMVLPALDRGGYEWRVQVETGTRPGGRRHQVDAIASKDGRSVLISVKWQQTSGTAEQKVPFEVMCLAEAINARQPDKAYLVLGGDGWTLREYFTSGRLSEHLIHSALVKVVTVEAFVRLANTGAL